MSDERKDRLGLFAFALALRMAAAWRLGAFLTLRDDSRFDDGAFIGMARDLLAGGPFAPPTHPPGYPAVLAPMLATGAAFLPLALLLQWALGAALAPMTHALSRRLGQARESALAAGALVALSPMLVFFSTRLMSETPFIALVAAFFLLWLRSWERGCLWWAAAAGVVGGLASLTRGVMLPFGGALALAALIRRREQARWLPLVAACGVAWAAAMAPWVGLNWKRFHMFVPVSVQGGWSFYEGLTVDPAEIAARPAKMGAEAQAQGFTGKDTVAIDAYFQKKANAWIKEHPGEFAVLTIRKALKFWRPFPYPPYSAAIRWAVGLFTLLLYALALLGLRAGAARAPGFGFVLAWALFLTLMHSILASALRYRLPLEPFLAVAAGAGLAELRRGLKPLPGRGF